MKLRIKGNSIRIRLMKAEVESLSLEDYYEDQVQFPGGENLIYTVRVEDEYRAEFRNNAMNVTVPKSDAEEWFSSDELSLRSTIPLTEGTLSLLIEKDLECMMPREGEDESGAYPNPKKGKG